MRFVLQNHVYWPNDKSQNVTYGPFIISLQSMKDKQTWIERILSVTHKTVSRRRYASQKANGYVCVDQHNELYD